MADAHNSLSYTILKAKCPEIYSIYPTPISDTTNLTAKLSPPIAVSINELINLYGFNFTIHKEFKPHSIGW